MGKTRKKNKRPLEKISDVETVAPTVARVLDTPYLFFSIPLLLGLISTWQLWEQDVFWQIRAGDEILSGLGLQTVDTWSFSAAGRPWINFQWLATVIIRILYGMGHEPGLVLWRAVFAGFLFTMMAIMLRRETGGKNFVLGWILLPWAFLCMAFKIELRSDLFNFLIFALVLLVWSSKLAHVKKYGLSLLLCLLAVNIHTGTAPFIIVLVLALFASDATLPVRTTLLWCAAAALTILVNPYGYKVFSPIIDIFFYSKTNQFDNYDHYPLSFDRRGLVQFGVAAWVWLIYALCSALAFLRAYLLDRKSKAFSRRSWAVMFVLGCVLTLLSINRMRAIPYHVLFFFPYVARAARDLISAPKPKIIHRGGFVAVAALLFFGFYLQEKNYPLARGLSLAPAAWPIGSTRFIAQSKPQGNILHTWGFGGYFVWHLRAYPTFGDPREAMFWDLQSRMLEAQQNPAAMRRLCDDYQIHVAVIPTPATQFQPEVRTFVDGLSGIFPRDEWALVYFDDISTVLVRRIPAHVDLIAANEFRFLRPQFPGTFYLRSSLRDPGSDLEFQKELHRCRSNEPRNVICRVAQAAFWQKSEDVIEQQAAQVLLEEVLDEPTTQKLELLLELKTIYHKRGFKDRMDDVEERIKTFIGQN